MGRDTDCVATVATGLTGALSGTSTIPEMWIKQVDYATSVNLHTRATDFFALINIFKIILDY